LLLLLLPDRERWFFGTKAAASRRTPRRFALADAGVLCVDSAEALSLQRVRLGARGLPTKHFGRPCGRPKLLPYL
jgi:hypothetical protein